MPLLGSGELFANRFVIDRAAGSGGMGTVYRALDRVSGAPTALKILQTHGKDPHEAKRFLHEAQILAELRHPGIVNYVAHGATPDGQRFLAMEWLDGEDLAQRLARGPLLVGEALPLIRDIAEALAVAHDHGIVHRGQLMSSFLIEK